MPVALRLDGFKFFFYANVGSPREPAHIYVRKAGAEAKFWLMPQVQLARNDGFDAHTLRQIASMVTERRQFLEAQYGFRVGGKKRLSTTTRCWLQNPLVSFKTVCCEAIAYLPAGKMVVREPTNLESI